MNIGSSNAIRVTVPPTTGIPVRGIIIWPLAFDQALYPQLAGWLLCDGTNGTPNYQLRFLRGALPPGDPVGGEGGAATHAHNVIGNVAAAGAHSHTITSYSHDHGSPFTTSLPSILENVCDCAAAWATAGACHRHTVSISGDDHDHGGTTGGELAHQHGVNFASQLASSLPPYINTQFIQRL